MRSRLPRDLALRHYLELGPTRSYRTVAERFRVHRSTVQAAAKRDDWPRKAREHDIAEFNKEREKSQADADAARARQLGIARHVIAKSLEGLKAAPLKTARDCLKALEIGLEQERAILNESPNESVFVIE